MELVNNLHKLKKQVSDGMLKIVHIEAIPRSVSTALGRALSETEEPSVYINEPFNRRKYDMNAAAGHILEVTEPLTHSSDKRLIVVTKNMARNLSVDILREWLPICDSVVWSIRDPLVQIASLLTRIANDLAYEPGADRITQEELGEHMEAVCSFLEDGPVSKNFSKTSWADIGDHFRSVHHLRRSVVVDGGELTAHPGEVLSMVCEKIGLKFSPRMVEDWRGNFINVNTGYNANLTDETHAWTKEAATSTGIMTASRPALKLEELPLSLRNHITKVAIPVYKEMIASNHQ